MLLHQNASPIPNAIETTRRMNQIEPLKLKQQHTRFKGTTMIVVLHKVLFSYRNA